MAVTVANPIRDRALIVECTMYTFDVDAFLGYLINEYLLEGVLFTIGLTFFPMVFAMILGSILALVIIGGGWPGWLARAYVWLFRGMPLLVLMVMIYTALPRIGLKFGVITSAVLALSLNEAAYISEIVRGGLMSVPTGQRDAARALGLSLWNTYYRVIGPQAMRVIIPPIGNSVNGLLKATSLASVISVEELMRRGQILMSVNFKGLEVYSAVAIYYVAMTTLWGFVQRPLERRFGRGYPSDRMSADFR